MTIENAVSFLDSLNELEYYPPKIYRQNMKFRYQSYMCSAINEIKIWLMNCKKKDAMESIEDFRYQMDCFACETKSGDANFMFSVYYDVATDVLDVLLNYK